MTIYTVHAPADLEANRPEAAERIVFVKEGLCWPALVVPVFWMLFRRIWIGLAFYIAAGIVLALLYRHAPSAGWPALAIGIALLLFIEGNDLRRWTLARRGFALIDVVEAGNRAEAEIRFFHRVAMAPPAPEPPAPPAAWTEPPPRSMPQPASAEIIGLFPTAGTVR